jgi:hypothetical protein
MPAEKNDPSSTLSLRQVLEEGDEKLCSALKRLDALERDLAGIGSFEFRSALPSDTVDLQVRAGAALQATGISNQDGPVVPPEAIAAHVYTVGRTANLLHAFRWTKKKAIAECLGSIKYALEHESLLPALVLTRTILEHIGTYTLFHRDVSSLTPANESPNAGGDWVLDVQYALGHRSMGTRIDWADYFGNGLKGKRRKKYEAKEGYFDHEAETLLKGIDLMDKPVRGVRNAYEFLSEFGHPNYPSYQLGVISTEIKRHRHGFRMLRKVYAGDRAPRVVVEELRFLLRDVWELLVASLEHFLELDKKFADVEKEVVKKTRSWVRKTLQLQHTVFRDADPCPCLSGKIVGCCCGRGVQHTR